MGAARPGTKYLIVNADDFGLTVGVNRGIMRAYRAGTISSVTVMANMPGFEDAVRCAKRHPRLGVGLHLNLTYGRSLCSASRVPSLVYPDGRFRGRIEQWDPNDIRRELRAQWNRLVAAGIRPTHIDSHQHIQMYPNVYRELVGFARRRHVPVRRVFYPPEKRLHPPTTHWFISATYFGPHAVSNLLRRLRTLRPGITEIHCHPGLCDPLLRKLSRWTTVRERELAVWTHPEVVRAIRSSPIRLLHFGDLARIQKRGNQHGDS